MPRILWRRLAALTLLLAFMLPSACSLSPSTLAFAGHYGGSVTDVTVKASGTLAAYSQGEFIHLVDIADKRGPKHISKVGPLGGDIVYDIEFVGEYLVAAAGSVNLAVFDISDSRKPKQVEKYQFPGEWTMSLAVQHERVFLSTGNKTLRMVSLKPENFGVTSWDLSSFVSALGESAEYWELHDLAITDNNILALSGESERLIVAEVAENLQLKPYKHGLVQDFGQGDEFDGDLVADRVYLHVPTEDAGTAVLDTLSGEITWSPEEQQEGAVPWLWYPTVAGSWLFGVTEESDGDVLYVVNTVHPFKQAVHRRYQVADGFRNFTATPDGTLVFVDQAGFGLVPLSTANDTAITGSLPVQDEGVPHIAAHPRESFLYAAGVGDGGIAVLDVSDPSKIKADKHLFAGHYLNDIAVGGRYLYLYAGNTLQSYDVRSDPLDPPFRCAQNFGKNGFGSQLSVKDGRAAITDRTNITLVGAEDGVITKQSSWAVGADGPVAFSGQYAYASLYGRKDNGSVTMRLPADIAVFDTAVEGKTLPVVSAFYVTDTATMPYQTEPITEADQLNNFHAVVAMETVGDYLFIGDTFREIALYALGNDPRLPERVGSYDLQHQRLDALVTDGSLVYAGVTNFSTHQSSIVAIDWRITSRPKKVAEYPLPTEAVELIVKSGVVYASTSEAGRYVLKLKSERGLF